MSQAPNPHRRAVDDCTPVEPAPAMTQEQLEWFTQQTERAVRVGLRPAIAKARRRDMQVFLTGYLVLLIGLSIALALPSREAAKARAAMVSSGKAVAVESCNRDYDNSKAFRSLLIQARAASRLNDTLSPKQRAISERFYANELKRFTLPDCRRSEALLTSNPDKSIPHIEPYYEGGRNPRGVKSPNPIPTEDSSP